MISRFWEATTAKRMKIECQRLDRNYRLNVLFSCVRWEMEVEINELFMLFIHEVWQDAADSIKCVITYRSMEAPKWLRQKNYRSNVPLSSIKYTTGWAKLSDTTLHFCL